MSNIVPFKDTTFEECVTDSAVIGETDDCSVKAVAIAARVSYSNAHKVLKACGRKNRKGASTGTISAAMFLLRAEMRSVDMNQLRMINHYRTLTVNNVVKYLRSDASYIMYTRDHVVAVRNGKVEDWTAGRKHRVLSVHQIIREEK